MANLREAISSLLLEFSFFKFKISEIFSLCEGNPLSDLFGDDIGEVTNILFLVGEKEESWVDERRFGGASFSFSYNCLDLSCKKRFLIDMFIEKGLSER